MVIIFNQILATISELDNETFWKANLAYKDAKGLLVSNSFTDIILAWAKFNYHNPTSATQIKTKLFGITLTLRKIRKYYLLPHGSRKR